MERNFKDYVKIKGDIDSKKANRFMNSLINKINKEYGKEWFLEASKEKLKFTIVFEEDEEENETEEQDMECIMEVKMYECNNNEFLLGFKKYPTPNEAVEELKQFLRYFTPKVLEDGDSIRKYVEKHRPKNDENK